MARFGQGVNPQLGALDFSPIMQGTSVAAQGIAQGGAARGQGYAQLGQSIGNAVQQYYQKQEEKQTQERAIDFMVKIADSDPKMAEGVGLRRDKDGQWDRKAVTAAVKTVGIPGVMQLGKSIMEQKQAEKDKRAINIGLSARRVGKMNMIDAIQSMGEEVTPFVANFLSQYANLESDTAKNYAQAQPKPAPGARMTMQQIAGLKAQGMDAKAVPLPDGSFQVEQISPFAPAPQTTVNMPGEDAFAKEAGKLVAEKQVKEFTAAQDAVASIGKLDEITDVLANGDPNTGILAEIKTNVDRVVSQFTADKKAGKRVTDTQVLDAMLGSDVFSMIGALGVGARGLDTPAEREFMRKVLTGEISMDKDALIRLTDIRRKIQERAIDKFNKSVDDGEYDRFFEVTKLRKRKFEAPKREAKPAGPRIISVEPIS